MRCQCGELVDVPTLRGLAGLQRGPSGAGKRRDSAWGNRHRAVLVLVVVGFASLVGTARLAATLPPLPVTPSRQEFEAWASGAPPGQVFETYNMLREGLTQTTEVEQIREQRRLRLWAIAGTAGATAVCLGSAGALLLARQRRPKTS